MVIGFFRTNEKYGFCSNWYKCDILVDGKEFNTCEQYMMYSKAMLFNDIEIAEEILKAKDAKTIKALGRKVRNFDSSKWNEVKELSVGKAVMAKFVQHPDLFKKLDSTGNNILAEASPYDTIWGIGIGPKDPDLQDQSKWKGTNLLGKTVMRVRELIRKGEVEFTL